MNEWLILLALGVALYAMKALPFFWRFLPRTPVVDTTLDLLPAALLPALLIPGVVWGVAAEPGVSGWPAVAAVAAALAVCATTGRAAAGIGCGLAILAAAQFL